MQRIQKNLTLLLSLSICSILLFSGLSSADIYKHNDKRYGVVYSDIPPLADTRLVKKTNEQSAAPKRTSAQTLGRYSEFKILSPAHLADITDPRGSVVINLAISPKLQDSHKIQILIDGTPQSTTRGSLFKLSGLPEGEHKLELHIIDNDNNVLMKSPLHKFRMLVEQGKN